MFVDCCLNKAVIFKHSTNIKMNMHVSPAHYNVVGLHNLGSKSKKLHSFIYLMKLEPCDD